MAFFLQNIRLLNTYYILHINPILMTFRYFSTDLPLCLQQVLLKRELLTESGLANGDESPKSISNLVQDKDFILDCLCWHNEYRARHSAPALTVSAEVSRK